MTEGVALLSSSEWHVELQSYSDRRVTSSDCYIALLSSNDYAIIFLPSSDWHGALLPSSD